MRRVVITGAGVVTPLGLDVRQTWDNLIMSKSGIRRTMSFDVKDYDARVAGEIPFVANGGSFEPTEYVHHKEARYMGKFSLFAIAAAKEAINDSGLLNNDVNRSSIGVVFTSGIGGLERIGEGAIEVSNGKKIGPFFLPSVLINTPGSYISMKYGLYGCNLTVSTACAGGNSAIGEAYTLIKSGAVDAIVVGGSESTICPVGVRAFEALRALSTNYNDAPETASRPWDKDRDGFVMSEGSGVLVMEEYESAVKRSAKIYAELLGYGSSSDGFHITAPRSDGAMAAKAIQNALNDANINCTDVDYISAHGTSTPLGDKAEILALRTIFGDHLANVPISSIKSSIGHTLGASGVIEAVLALKSFETSLIPPTLNLHQPDQEFADLNLVPLVAQKKRCNVILSNAFGFGGTNAVLVLANINR